jgi:hypothetical protein
MDSNQMLNAYIVKRMKSNGSDTNTTSRMHAISCVTYAWAIKTYVYPNVNNGTTVLELLHWFNKMKPEMNPQVHPTMNLGSQSMFDPDDLEDGKTVMGMLEWIEKTRPDINTDRKSTFTLTDLESYRDLLQILENVSWPDEYRVFSDVLEIALTICTIYLKSTPCVYIMNTLMSSLIVQLDCNGSTLSRPFVVYYAMSCFLGSLRSCLENTTT